MTLDRIFQIYEDRETALLSFGVNLLKGISWPIPYEADAQATAIKDGQYDTKYAKYVE